MREIEVDEFITVHDLARLIEVRVTRIIQTAFDDLGRLVTIHDALPFEESRALLARLGYVARRREK